MTSGKSHKATQLILVGLTILATLESHLVTTSDSPDLKVIVYAHQRFRGDSFKITGLKKIGDCKEFWNRGRPVDPVWAEFNDRAYSIALGDGVCVRLYENDCDWTIKGRILDTTPNSAWVSDFGLIGFGGIVSAVKIIECPLKSPPLVSLYKETNYQGSKVELYELQKVGDCVQSWSPLGYDAMISQHLRRFDNQAKSIKLREGVCVRLFEHNCGSQRRILDTTQFSPWTNDLSRMWFNGILSAVQLITCPETSGIIGYSSVNFQGESIALDGLQKVGDCVQFSNPAGEISEHLRRFNDRMHSIKIPQGLCVRLNKDQCGTSGSTMDMTSDTVYASNLGRQYFGGVVSSVELTCKNATTPAATNTPTPTPSIVTIAQSPTDTSSDRGARSQGQNCPAIVEPKPCVCACDPSGISAENEIGDEPETTNSKTPKVPIFLEIPKITVKPLTPQIFEQPETSKLPTIPKTPKNPTSSENPKTRDLPQIQPTNNEPKLPETRVQQELMSTTKTPVPSSSPGLIPDSDVWKIIGALKCIDIPPTLIEEMGYIFQYYISGKNGGEFYLDLKNAPGMISSGRSEEEPDVTFKMSDVHFVQLMTEKITGMEAYMNSYVVVEGGWLAIMKAQQLETALNKLKDSREKIDLLNAPRYC